MNVFVYDFKTRGKIVALCRAQHYAVLTAQSVRRRRSAPKNVHFFLDEVDALILEITKPTQDSHFIVAQALLAKKPLLCLYGKNQPPRALLAMVRDRKTKMAKTFSYTMANLPEAVTKFLTTFQPSGDHYDQEPNIKYTLRLSPKWDRYLEWVCRRERISKADYFRLFLEQQAMNDPQYADLRPKYAQRLKRN